MCTLGAARTTRVETHRRAARELLKQSEGNSRSTIHAAGVIILTKDLTVSLRASFSAVSARTDASLSRTICKLWRSSASTPSSCLVNASCCLWSAARNLY
jgi:hypothetical protein